MAMRSPVSCSPVDDESDRPWPTPDGNELVEEISRQHSPPTASSARILRVPLVRRRPHDQSNSQVPRTFASFSFSPSQDAIATERYYSDASSSSAFTFTTSSSTASTDPWSTSGFVEMDELNVAHDDTTPSMAGDETEEFEALLEPKTEPPENDTILGDLEMADAALPDAVGVPLQKKRPRGRPRKHPVPNHDALAKVAKGRSKTGCITCRKRKKKCDEAKPRCESCHWTIVIIGQNVQRNADFDQV